MQNSTRKLPLHSTLTLSAFVLFLALTIGSSITNRPMVDEAMFASPAFNLATKGFLGTTILETEKSPLTRIEERTYWVMPLFLLNVSASFKAFGMSLLTMRLVSVFWGIVLLAAWYFIVLKLSGNRNIALLCLILLAGNYTVLETASLGRMDLMSASLGFSALAVYLGLRERDLSQALFFSHCLIVTSGLTHPNGIFAFLGLVFTTLYLDWQRLEIKHFAFAAVPYLVGGTVFGWWVWQDPTAFREQFIDNALMSGRMQSASSPLSGIVREFTEKYPHAHGLVANSGGHSGPIYLKSLILVGYVIGTLGVIFTKSLRQNRNYFLLLILTAIYFLAMALIDGQKQTPYLIHIVPFYCALLAIWLESAWQKRFAPRLLLIVGVSTLMLVQIGGMAMRTKQNTYSNVYLPAIDFIRQNTGENELIMGNPTLGFALGFPENLVGDARFGYLTGKRPRVLVYDDESYNSWKKSEKFYPELYEYIPKLLHQEYNLVYENPAYKVYIHK